jgi:hypothetical protein
MSLFLFLFSVPYGIVGLDAGDNKESERKVSVDPSFEAMGLREDLLRGLYAFSTFMFFHSYSRYSILSHFYLPKLTLTKISCTKYQFCILFIYFILLDNVVHLTLIPFHSSLRKTFSGPAARDSAHF